MHISVSKRKHSAYSFLIILNRIQQYSSHLLMNSLASSFISQVPRHQLKIDYYGQIHGIPHHYALIYEQQHLYLNRLLLNIVKTASKHISIFIFVTI